MVEPSSAAAFGGDASGMPLELTSAEGDVRAQLMHACGGPAPSSASGVLALVHIAGHVLRRVGGWETERYRSSIRVVAKRVLCSRGSRGDVEREPVSVTYCSATEAMPLRCRRLQRVVLIVTPRIARVVQGHDASRQVVVGDDLSIPIRPKRAEKGMVAEVGVEPEARRRARR